MINLKNKLKVLVFSIAILMFIGCPEPPENPPEAPRLVAKSAPDAIIEKGIDVDIQTSDQAIVLMWHPNTESDLAGYKIYRNADLVDSSFRIIEDISVNSGDTLYFDEDIIKMNEYHYYINAYNNNKEKSEPSDTVNYAISNQPFIIFPDNIEVGNDTLKFRWIDDPYRSQYPDEYVIRIEEQGSNLIWEWAWIARFINIYYRNPGTPPIEIPYFEATPPYTLINIISSRGKYDLLPNGNYRWKIKTIIELDNSTDLDLKGSESTWSYFTIK